MMTASQSATNHTTTTAPYADLQEQRIRLLERLMPLAEQPGDTPTAYVATPLKRFCTELVDYLALGHCHIMNHIDGGWPYRAAIAKTTEDAMRFAEQHEDVLGHAEVAPSWRAIRAQLSGVALMLTDRFDTEDALFNRA